MKCKLISTWKMSCDGMKKGAQILKNNAPIHEAIIAAIKDVENNENFVSVGYGGLPNFEGEVELDAAYMNGDTFGFGGIMAVRDIKNPIEVAYDLSKYKRNCLLAQQGAIAYAKQKGFMFQNMLTDKTKQRYLEQKQEEINMEVLDAYKGHDTVCVIGRDNNESIAVGVSTSGLYMKLPGRVGDSPIIGSGFYADSNVGAAAATGVGEDIMKGCLSYDIISKMRDGMDVQNACEKSLRQHIDRLKQVNHECSSISVIAMDSNGYFGAATNIKEFPFVVVNELYQTEIYVVSNISKEMRIYKATKSWLENYRGD